MKKPIWLTHDQMNQWDEFVFNHPYGWICHLSGWKEVLSRSFRHIDGRYLALWDEDSKKITAGIPVYLVNSWLIGKRIVSVPYATLFDPLISSSEDMEMLLPPIRDLYNEHHVSSMEIRSLFSTPDVLEKYKFSKSQNYKNHYLPLDDTLENIMESFHRASKRNIHKAIDNHLTNKIAVDTTDLYKFYQLYFKTRKRLGLPPLPYKFFKVVWEIFSSSKKVVFMITELNNHPVAALMIMRFKERVSAEYLGWEKIHNNISTPSFIYWEAIKLAHNEGYKIFDFGRTSTSNKNLMVVKGRWGTHVVDMPIFYFPESVLKEHGERESSWKYHLIKGISKKFPDFLFKMLGEFCYSHLG